VVVIALAASPVPAAVTTNVGAERESGVDNALLQFTKLRETLVRVLHLDADADADADADGSDEDADKWKYAAKWTVHDGWSLYVADCLDMPSTGAALARLAERTTTRCRWRCVGTIEKFVAAACRTAFPEIVAAIVNGQRDDTDICRVRIAGEYFLRERVAFVGGAGVVISSGIDTVTTDIAVPRATSSTTQ